MGLYDSMELEVIAAEQNWRVANNHIAADLASICGRSPAGAWSLCNLMFAQVCNGVHKLPVSKRRKLREIRKWEANPALLREEWT